jgi:hypothetical protein
MIRIAAGIFLALSVVVTLVYMRLSPRASSQ